MKQGFSKLLYLKSLHGVKMEPASAYRVLVTILDYADADGTNAWPGVARLAKDCCMSERQLQRCLDKLREGGFVHEDERGGRDRGNKASVYSVPTRQNGTYTTSVTELDDISDGPTRQNGQTYTTSADKSPANLDDTGVTPPDPLPDPPLPDPLPSPDDQGGDARNTCPECEEPINGWGQHESGNWDCVPF